MTNAQIRRLTNRLNDIDKIHDRMGKQVDSLQQDLLKLKMESHELRSDLQDLIDDPHKTTGRSAARTQASAVRQKV